MRFYDVTGGGVRLDGHDVRDLTQTSIRQPRRRRARRAVPVLRDDPGQHRLRPARRRPTTRSCAAAEAAQADDFMRELPDGYDTVIGERGLRPVGRAAPAHRHRPHAADRTRACWCSTTPPAPSTCAWRRPSTRRSPTAGPVAPRSSSPTGSPPSPSPTGWCCSRAGGSWPRAATPTCWRPSPATPRCWPASRRTTTASSGDFDELPMAEAGLMAWGGAGGGFGPGGDADAAPPPGLPFAGVPAGAAGPGRRHPRPRARAPGSRTSAFTTAVRPTSARSRCGASSPPTASASPWPSCSWSSRRSPCRPARS